MEKRRNKVVLRIVTIAKDYEKIVSKPTFVSQMIFKKRFVAIKKIKEMVTLNETAYVGGGILD